ncbi:hypothetical protein SCP_1104240 [Sparassis crispa]|uniref:Uncharacterized protein n=1 Tax=Sparassis crispa TaxID=139825 RepID=A0A401H001_9APHY|nr:hypothetical protein SCP_1104240 [Sparassis crispa]GBE87747.1 hypothetical protein SCP_1104240 [Sparassis crispa]
MQGRENKHSFRLAEAPPAKLSTWKTFHATPHIDISTKLLKSVTADGGHGRELSSFS